jgi:hypothetical protein
MRTRRHHLRVSRLASAWLETRSGRVLAGAASAATLTAADILSIKARLVLDARRLPARRRRSVQIAALMVALAGGAAVLVSLL